MEITGNDIVIFSDIPIERIRLVFEMYLLQKWDTPIIKEFENLPDKHVEVFYARDKEMYDRHDDVGYELNANGESCFMLISMHLKNWVRDVTIHEHQEEDGITTEEYKTKCFFKRIWMHTLVVPGLPEDDPFSKWVYDAFCQAINLEICPIKRTKEENIELVRKILYTDWEELQLVYCGYRDSDRDDLGNYIFAKKGGNSIMAF